MTRFRAKAFEGTMLLSRRNSFCEHEAIGSFADQAAQGLLGYPLLL
jgi:hypothetical protein